MLAHWPDVPLIEWARQSADPETAHGTTIALVKDVSGEIGGGVSTCGWAYKYPGRLGDSPIIGAGVYADSRYGAAGCTGMGELTIRTGTARAVVLYMKMGLSVEAACREAVADLRSAERRFKGGVTIHAIDADGPSLRGVRRACDRHGALVFLDGGNAGVRGTADGRRGVVERSLCSRSGRAVSCFGRRLVAERQRLDQPIPEPVAGSSWRVGQHAGTQHKN